MCVCNNVGTNESIDILEVSILLGIFIYKI